MDHFLGFAEHLIERALRHEWVWRILIGLGIAVVGLWLARWLSRALDRLMHRLTVEDILRNFLRNAAYAMTIIVVSIVALDFAGVPTSSLLAIVGAAGLAIGLALKDSLSNIASGVMLIVLRPFRTGDSVEVAGQEGVIDSVRIFQTRLHTADNREIILPNSQITSSPIVNFTVRGERRIDLNLSISHSKDIAIARQCLLSVTAKNAQVLQIPAPEVRVTDLTDGVIILQLRAWVQATEHATVRSELLEQTALLLTEHNVRLVSTHRGCCRQHDTVGAAQAATRAQ